MSKLRKPHGTVAMIESRAFEFEKPNETNSGSEPEGQSFADFVAKQLVASGGRMTSKPVPGEDGWSFDVELDARVYRFFVHWAPIGNPPSDRWIIQTDVRKSLLGSLIAKKTVEADISTAVDILHTQLSNASEIDEMTWLTAEEFAHMY
jgi:hypothetical protein